MHLCMLKYPPTAKMHHAFYLFFDSGTHLIVDIFIKIFCTLFTCVLLNSKNEYIISVAFCVFEYFKKITFQAY